MSLKLHCSILRYILRMVLDSAQGSFFFFTLGMVICDCSVIGPYNVVMSQWQQLQDSLVMSSSGFTVTFSSCWSLASGSGF